MNEIKRFLNDCENFLVYGNIEKLGWPDKWDHEGNYDIEQRTRIMCFQAVKFLVRKHLSVNWLKWDEWFNEVNSTEELKDKLNLYSLEHYVDYKFCVPCLWKRYPILKQFSEHNWISFKKINTHVGFNFVPENALLNAFTCNVILNYIFLNRLPSIVD